MLPRRSSSNVWLLAITSSCALALLAWQLARMIPLREGPRPLVAIPVRATLAVTQRVMEEDEFDLDESAESLWSRAHVDVPVELEPALADRADEACVLPVEHDERIERGWERPYGWFDAPNRSELRIVHGYSSSFSGSGVELRLKRDDRGGWTCSALVTDSGDVGPPFTVAWRHPSGRVRSSSLDWKRGEFVFLHYRLDEQGEEGERVREGLVRILGP